MHGSIRGEATHVDEKRATRTCDCGWRPEANCTSSRLYVHVNHFRLGDHSDTIDRLLTFPARIGRRGVNQGLKPRSLFSARIPPAFLDERSISALIWAPIRHASPVA